MKTVKGILFWLASCTWGIILTLAGAAVALALLVTGHKPHRFHYFIYFEVGKDWGGFEVGGFFVVCKHAGLSIKQHEAGHGLQNIMLGVLMPFLVSIPSAVRYWWRRWQEHKGRGELLKPYDSIWFEGWATSLGKKYYPMESG